MLAFILFLASTVTAIWATTVPLFQEPDEIAHLDYALAFFDAGGLFHVRSATGATEVTPQVRYVSAGLRYRAVRYNPLAHYESVSKLYARYSELDRSAPGPSGRPPRDGARVPYELFVYPPAYYWFEANVIARTYSATGSLTRSLIAARLANLLFLNGTLLLAFATMRAYRVSRRNALVGTAAIGLFPLTSWLFAYVQPDCFTIFCAALTIAAMARYLRTNRGSDLAFAGVSLALLFFAKQHIAIAFWCATLLTCITRQFGPHRIDWRRLIVLVGVLPFSSMKIASDVFTIVASLERPLHFLSRTWTERGDGKIFSLGDFFTSLARATVGAFVYGDSANGYWQKFGFRAGTIFPASTTSAIAVALAGLTCVALGIFVVSRFAMLRRIASVARRGRAGTAVSLFGSAHAMNAYVFLTCLLLLTNAATGGVLELQGRYWLVVIPSLYVTLLVHNARPLASTLRQSFQTIVATSLVAFSSVASLSGIVQMHRDFYGRSLPLHNVSLNLMKIASPAKNDRVDGLPVASGKRDIIVTGETIDQRVGRPAHGVFAIVDRSRRIDARVGLPSPRMRQIFNDDEMRLCGFLLRIPAGALATGNHNLQFYIAGANGKSPIPFSSSLTFRTS